MIGWAGVREPLACVGFWFAHEIVGHIIPDLEKEIVILSMNRTIRNEDSSLVGNAAPMSANSRYGLPLRPLAQAAKGWFVLRVPAAAASVRPRL